MWTLTVLNEGKQGFIVLMNQFELSCCRNLAEDFIVLHSSLGLGLAIHPLA